MGFCLVSIHFLEDKKLLKSKSSQKKINKAVNLLLKKESWEVWHKVSLTRTLVTLSKSRSLTLQGSGWWVWHCRKCQRIECNERSRQSLTSGQDVVNALSERPGECGGASCLIPEWRLPGFSGGLGCFAHRRRKVEEWSMGGPEGEGAWPFMVWFPSLVSSS